MLQEIENLCRWRSLVRHFCYLLPPDPLGVSNKLFRAFQVVRTKLISCTETMELCFIFCKLFLHQSCKTQILSQKDVTFIPVEAFSSYWIRAFYYNQTKLRKISRRNLVLPFILITLQCRILCDGYVMIDLMHEVLNFKGVH